MVVRVRSGRSVVVGSMRTAHLLAAILLLPTAGNAEVFVPASPDTVLLHVASSDDAKVEQLRAMRAELAERPRDAALAVRFARSAITHARRTHDPRWYGYAEGALQPWQDVEQVPPDIRVVRATLAQHDHRFQAALDDLNRALQQAPEHLQGRLTRGVIHTVQARYAPAIDDCNVVRRYHLLLGTACAATAMSLSGKADRALRALQTAIALGGSDPEARRWALTVRAEIGWRLGRPETGAWFRQALDAPGAESDMQLQLGYADFLLHREQAREALSITRAFDHSNDGLILSLRARMALGESGKAIAEDQRRLMARLEAERARGGARHFGTEAMAALHIAGQQERALWLAERNWTIQKTPADARLLLQAALASERPSAADPVREWRRAHGVQDQRIDHLLQALEASERPAS